MELLVLIGLVLTAVVILLAVVEQVVLHRPSHP
jgi:hypothetical protein